MLARREVRLFAGTPDHVRPPAAVGMGRVSQPPARAVLDQPEDARAVGEFRVQVAAGAMAHGIAVEGELAGWGFMRQLEGSIPVPEANGALLPSARGDVVLTAFYVRIRHRGRGLYQQLLAEMGHAAFAAGAPRAWIYAYTDNAPSCRAIMRAGYEPVGRWVAWRVLGRSRHAWHAEAAERHATPQSAGETSTRLS